MDRGALGRGVGLALPGRHGAQRCLRCRVGSRRTALPAAPFRPHPPERRPLARLATVVAGSPAGRRHRHHAYEVPSGPHGEPRLRLAAGNRRRGAGGAHRAVQRRAEADAAGPGGHGRLPRAECAPRDERAACAVADRALGGRSGNRHLYRRGDLVRPQRRPPQRPPATRRRRARDAGRRGVGRRAAVAERRTMDASRSAARAVAVAHDHRPVGGVCARRAAFRRLSSRRRGLCGRRSAVRSRPSSSSTPPPATPGPDLGMRSWSRCSSFPQRSWSGGWTPDKTPELAFLSPVDFVRLSAPANPGRCLIYGRVVSSKRRSWRVFGRMFRMQSSRVRDPHVVRLR